MITTNKNTVVTFLLILVLLMVSVGGAAQSKESKDVGVSPWLDNLLTFVDSFAEIIGNALNNVIGQITGEKLPNLSKPLGYLGILTISLAAFGALQAARKIIWFLVLVGWGLIIARIAMELLTKGGTAQ